MLIIGLRPFDRVSSFFASPPLSFQSWQTRLTHSRRRLRKRQALDGRRRGSWGGEGGGGGGGLAFISSARPLHSKRRGERGGEKTRNCGLFFFSFSSSWRVCHLGGWDGVGWWVNLSLTLLLPLMTPEEKKRDTSFQLHHKSVQPSTFLSFFHPLDFSSSSSLLANWNRWKWVFPSSHSFKGTLSGIGRGLLPRLLAAFKMRSLRRQKKK